MTDIVNELRAVGELRQDETCRDTFENTWAVCMLAINAADEIERLRNIIQRQHDILPDDAGKQND